MAAINVPYHHINKICIGARNDSSKRCVSYGLQDGWRGTGSGGTVNNIAYRNNNRQSCMRMEDALLTRAKADPRVGKHRLKNVNCGGGGALGLRHKDAGGKTHYASDPGGYCCYLVYQLNEAGLAAERVASSSHCSSARADDDDDDDDSFDLRKQTADPLYVADGQWQGDERDRHIEYMEREVHDLVTDSEGQEEDDEDDDEISEDDDEMSEDDSDHDADNDVLSAPRRSRRTSVQTDRLGVYAETDDDDDDDDDDNDDDDDD
jgi:hypothetical protein